MSRSLSRSVVVQAPPERVFDLLADPARHADFDGSGTVQGRLRGPARLGPGTRFGMRMRLGVPYVISNTVVEFEEGRQIAWRHFAGHIWRYRLEPAGASSTQVSEEFDPTTSRSPLLLTLMGASRRNQRSIEQTLVRLEEWALART